jgi:hypothetical protein
LSPAAVNTSTTTIKRHPTRKSQPFDYGDAELVFEVRGFPTGGEATIEPDGPNFIGNVFYGERGYLSLDHRGYQIFLGPKREPGESGKAEPGDTGPHMQNFLDAVKSRRVQDLRGDVQEGVTSASLVHMANISYRLGRKLEFDPATESFPHDTDANAMRPKYREPYVFPSLG